MGPAHRLLDRDTDNDYMITGSDDVFVNALKATRL